MDSAANKAEGLRLADDDVVGCALEVVDATSLLARKVTSISDEWRVVEG